MSEPNWPPLPVDFYPGCSVYSLGDGKYLIDDREANGRFFGGGWDGGHFTGDSNKISLAF